MVNVYTLKCNRCGQKLIGTKRDSAFSCKECRYFKFFDKNGGIPESKGILLNKVVENYTNVGDEIDYFFYGNYDSSNLYLPFWNFLVEISFSDSSPSFFHKLNGKWNIFFPAFKYSGYLYFGNPGEKLISFGNMNFESYEGTLVGVDASPFYSYVEAVFLFIKFIDRKRDITDVEFEIKHIDTKIIGIPFEMENEYLKTSVNIKDQWQKDIKREIKIPQFTVDSLDDILEFYLEKSH